MKTQNLKCSDNLILSIDRKSERYTEIVLENKSFRKQQIRKIVQIFIFYFVFLIVGINQLWIHLTLIGILSYILVISSLNLVKREELKIIADVGIEISVQFTFASQNRFIPKSNIVKMVLNEVLYLVSISDILIQSLFHLSS